MCVAKSINRQPAEPWDLCVREYFSINGKRFAGGSIAAKKPVKEETIFSAESSCFKRFSPFLGKKKKTEQNKITHIRLDKLITA